MHITLWSYFSFCTSHDPGRKKSTWTKINWREFNQGVRDLVWVFGVNSGWEWLPPLNLKESERKEQLLELRTPGPGAGASDRTYIQPLVENPTGTWAGKHTPQLHSPCILHYPARGSQVLNTRGNRKWKEVSMDFQKLTFWGTEQEAEGWKADVKRAPSTEAHMPLCDFNETVSH